MQSRPHVSLLSLHYPPEPTGNAPYVGRLASGLARRGYSVNAHVAHPHYPEWELRPGYGQWSKSETDGRVLVRRRLHYVPQPPRGLRRLISELSFGVRLLIGRWGRPDVVIAASPALFATALATLRARLTPHRPAIVVWVQDLYSLGLAETGEGQGIAARVTRWVESATLRAADRVVTIHPRFQSYATTDLGVAPSKTVVIRNWTHLAPADDLDPSECRDQLRWQRGATIAVHTGNMGVKQGLENIVEAARLADEREVPVCFILVGDGGERERLQAVAQGISRVRFVAPLSDADYRRALAASDVLLVNERPGVAAMAVPSKLTSYFDVGRPIVAATAAAGITAEEIETSGGGIVVPAGDPAALLDAVLDLSGDSARAKRLGARGRAYRRKELSEESALSSFAGLVDELIEARSSATGKVDGAF